MSTHAKTIIAGITAKVGAFLTAWSIYGAEWSSQILGIFPKEQAGRVVAVTTVLTLTAGIYKTILDAKGNDRAKAANQLLGVFHE